MAEQVRTVGVIYLERFPSQSIKLGSSRWRMCYSVTHANHDGDAR
jgi:hypothetical protein